MGNPGLVKDYIPVHIDPTVVYMTVNLTLVESDFLIVGTKKKKLPRRRERKTIIQKSGKQAVEISTKEKKGNLPSGRYY